jgi:hypothetical protein
MTALSGQPTDDPTRALEQAAHEGSGVFAALLLVEQQNADPRPAAEIARQQGHTRLADALDEAAQRLSPTGP